MITVFVNDSKIEVEKHINIQQLLHKTKTSLSGIAIAVNNEIIPKNDWNSKQIDSNDNILIIKATQGG